MKIKFSTAITNQKNNNLLRRVRKFFIEKIKPLANDSFEKNVEKQTEKKVIISRKHPNLELRCETLFFPRSNLFCEQVY